MLRIKKLLLKVGLLLKCCSFSDIPICIVGAETIVESPAATSRVQEEQLATLESTTIEQDASKKGHEELQLEFIEGHYNIC
jgi:hypothetical protein